MLGEYFTAEIGTFTGTKMFSNYTANIAHYDISYFLCVVYSLGCSAEIRGKLKSLLQKQRQLIRLQIDLRKRFKTI